MRKTNLFVTATVVTTFFVMTLIFLSLSGDGTKRLNDLFSQSESSTDSEISVTAPDVTTDSAVVPTPTDIPVFIPQFEDIPSSYTVGSIKSTANGMVAEETESGYHISWQLLADADYYLLCVSGDHMEYSLVQILTSDVYEWEYPESGVVGFLLIAFRDDGQLGTDDDRMIKAYHCVVLLPTATPTPTKGPTPTRIPNPTKIPTPTPAPSRYKIIVDKADFAFAVFEIDENGTYSKKIVTYPAALGSGTKTPVGSFKIGAKTEWKAWSGSSYSPYASRYASNSYGSVYFHGPVYSSMNFGDMNASSYNAIGTASSGGCVRTTVAGARFVYYNCVGGTLVEVVNSSDLVSYPGKPPIDPDFPTWDPTDPNKPTLTPTPTVTPTPVPTPSPTPEPTPEPTPTPTTEPTTTSSGEPSEST
ncbi:MAG: L,D-transpeptidase [Clostridiaceae bacterium]|nr:L,D-transpeptidase [Clostridiaceae bacterium]